MRNVSILAKVLAVYDVREFSNERGAGKVGSFMIADDTGRTRAACWHAATEKMSNIKTGDIVRIKNAFCRENNGQAELSINDASEIEINPSGEKVEISSTFSDARPDAARKKISELTEKDINVELLGTVVQAFEPKFFEICPNCGKRAKARENVFVCDQHDIVSPDYSYVMNAVIDDGSETIRAVFFREQFEQLVNRPREEILKYREFAEKFNELKFDLLGQMVKLQGRVTKNSMFDRLEFVARTVVTNPDPREELERLRKEVTI
jgi:replication factor A1